tara:strand:+ start:856 stop:1392 length:537 start_codon:yes stop_codon:yes gene_type:complete
MEKSNSFIMFFFNEIRQGKINMIAFYLIVTLMTCNQSIADIMTDTLDQKCTLEELCEFDLSVVTDFEWDKVYIFREYFTEEDISKTIGINWTGSEVGNNNQRFVFIKDNKVVYVEDFDTFNTNVQFRRMNWVEGTPASEPIKYSRKEAVFIVVKKTSKGRKSGYFFDLYPVDGTLKPK